MPVKIPFEGEMRNPKSILSAALAFSAMVGISAASAADLPARTYSKAPAMVADPVASWSGFYVGGNVGWGSGGPNQTISDLGTLPPIFFPNTTFNNNANSALGGIQLGYNWQFAPTWLVGIEGDISWSHITKSGSLGPPIASPNFGGTLEPFSLQSTTTLDGIGSVRGRVGYTTPNWLAFLSGGAAWARTKMNGNLVCPPSGFCLATGFNAPVSSTDTRFGYALGAGFEYKADRSPWIFGLEYLHYHFEGTNMRTSQILGITNGVPSPGIGDCAGVSQCVGYSSGGFNVETVRARVSYKFGN